MKILQPPHWPRPKGYSNGISASGRMIFTAGVVTNSPLERLYRDIRALRIYEGASEVQQVIIAGQTLHAFAAAPAI